MNIISILLIEDEPDVVNFVKKGLGEESFEVSVALNGVDGLEMALNNQYDIVPRKVRKIINHLHKNVGGFLFFEWLAFFTTAQILFEPIGSF